MNKVHFIYGKGEKYLNFFHSQFRQSGCRQTPLGEVAPSSVVRIVDFKCGWDNDEVPAYNSYCHGLPPIRVGDL